MMIVVDCDTFKCAVQLKYELIGSVDVDGQALNRNGGCIQAGPWLLFVSLLWPDVGRR